MAPHLNEREEVKQSFFGQADRDHDAHQIDISAEGGGLDEEHMREAH